MATKPQTNPAPTKADKPLIIRIDWEGPFVPFIPRNPKTGYWGNKEGITFHHASAAFAPPEAKPDLKDADKEPEKYPTLGDPAKDYGIYQIYGASSVYGTDTLWYIGLAGENLARREKPTGDRTFAARLREHTWKYGFTDIKFYVGRLMGEKQLTPKEWSQHIRLAERMLIYFNSPSHNSKSIASLGGKSTQAPDDHSKKGDGKILKTRRVCVWNYGDYQLLIPECSNDYLCDHPLYDKKEAKWYSRKRYRRLAAG